MERRKVSLYKICLRRVNNLLKAGTWKKYSVNPFLNFPSGIVDDVLSRIEYDTAPIYQALPLLTSGSVTRLELTGFEVGAERELFLETIQRNCYKSVRYITWYSGDYSSIPLIETLIRSCPKLEEFQSCQFFNIDVFQNCKELRVLRIFVPPPMRDFKFSPSDLSVMGSLKNLQVLFFSDIMGSDSIIMADVLKHCPHLLSVGSNDCLKSLEKIHADSRRECEIDCTEVPDQFQLRKCVWGENTNALDRMAVDDAISYKSSFPEKIRIAVSLCPFVEELVMCVSHADSIVSLKHLNRLTCLKISFVECDNDCMTNFAALLKMIGPNLRYLSVNSRQPVPVDIVCDCCPRLQNLEIEKLATASEPVLPHRDVLLKTLRIRTVDQNALLILLSRCKALVELSLCDALCLEDSLLDRILRQNPLAQLKICDITACSLTKRGFRMFLQKAASLERVKFASFRRDIASVVENLINELNLTNVTYGEMFDLPHHEFGLNF